MQMRPPRPHRFKHWVFDHFWWIALLLALALVVFTGYRVNSNSGEWGLLLTLWGSFLSALYLIQKQKLEETRLFAELFQAFNGRYDAINADLNDLLNESEESELNGDQVDLLYDYFNLCAEEYLFYEKGYIPPEVWTAWKNGMRTFMQDERIRELWHKEKQSDSYYGLEMPLLGKHSTNKIKRMAEEHAQADPAA